jgi:glutaredoxin 2
LYALAIKPKSTAQSDAAAEGDSLLKELQQRFIDKWNAKQIFAATDYIDRIKKIILQFPSLKTPENYQWLRQKKEEISDFLISQFLTGLALNEHIIPILDQIASLGYIKKVLPIKRPHDTISVIVIILSRLLKYICASRRQRWIICLGISY